MVRRRHDLVALHVNDPRERNLLQVGLLTMEDAETGEMIEIDTGSAGVRERFAERARERDQRLERALRANRSTASRSTPRCPIFRC